MDHNRGQVSGRFQDKFTSLIKKKRLVVKVKVEISTVNEFWSRFFSNITGFIEKQD